VHEDLFELDTAGATAVMLRDYTARELTVRPGDELDVIEALDGWLLCRSPSGLVGWVPAESTEALLD